MCYKQGTLVSVSFAKAAENKSEWALRYDELGYDVPLSAVRVADLLEQNDGKPLMDGQKVFFPTHGFQFDKEGKVVDLGQIYTVEGVRRHSQKVLKESRLELVG
ncbi:hypothetical protein EBT16_12205 [bacterium]|nr:hypothetical protein [bacterium]